MKRAIVLLGCLLVLGGCLGPTRVQQWDSMLLTAQRHLAECEGRLRSSTASAIEECMQAKLRAAVPIGEKARMWLDFRRELVAAVDTGRLSMAQAAQFESEFRGVLVSHLTRQDAYDDQALGLALMGVSGAINENLTLQGARSGGSAVHNYNIRGQRFMCATSGTYTDCR